MPCVRATATSAQIRRLAENKAVGAIHFDDVSAINDLADSIAVARSDRAHQRRLRWHRHPRRGLGRRPECHDQSDLCRPVHHQPIGERPRPTRRRRSSRTPSQQAPRPRPGLRPVLGEHLDIDALRWAVRDQHCTVVSQSFHREQRTRWFRSPVGRPVEGLPGAALAIPDDRASGRQLLRGDADNISRPRTSS